MVDDQISILGGAEGPKAQHQALVVSGLDAKRIFHSDVSLFTRALLPLVPSSLIVPWRLFVTLLMVLRPIRRLRHALGPRHVRPP